MKAKRIWLVVAVAIVAVGLGCSTDSPTAPQQTPAPPGGTQVSAFWDIDVKVSPDEIAQSAIEPARVSIQVRNRDDNLPPPQGTTIVVSTSLGEFVDFGSGLTSIALGTTNGRAETLFFPGDIEGTAVVTAQLESSAGQTGVAIREGVVADFEFRNGEVNLSIQFINRSTGDPRRFFWEFGDGGTSREENPAHQFADPGDYVVSLRVERGTFTDRIVTPVFVVEPLFITDISPNEGPMAGGVTIRGVGFVKPLRVRFDSFTADVPFVSPDRNRINAIVPFMPPEAFDTGPCPTVDDTGMEVMGTQMVATLFDVTVERIPVSPGNTSDTLINAFVVFPASDTCEAASTGGTGGTGGTANSAPTASFLISCTSLTCAFADTSIDTDGAIVAWAWEFGDGGTSTLQNPTHVFSSAGTYTITLTVADDVGATDTVAQTLNVS